MKVVYTPTARRHIETQLAYLIDKGAAAPARRLRHRITSFVTDFLARHPRACRYIGERDIFETWIPRTPYVIIYRVSEKSDTLTVLALFHAARDRTNFNPPKSS